jgi:hypothetical protein
MQKSYKTARVARVVGWPRWQADPSGTGRERAHGPCGFGLVGSVSPGPNNAVLWALSCGSGSAQRSHTSWARPWGRPASAQCGGQGRDAPAVEVVLKVVRSVPLLSGLPGRREEMEDSLRR